MVQRATVTAPEMIGLLVWWILVLAAPVIAGLRWRRRRRAVRGQSRRKARLLPRARPHAAAIGSSRSAPTTIGPPNGLTPRRRQSSARRPRTGRRLTAVPSRLSPRPPRVRAARMLRIRRCRVCGAGTLEPLCRYVDFQRRLELAASELRRRLTQLPAGRWRVEPYPLTGERRNTLLVLGETGVFVISATYPPGGWDDVVTASRLAAKIQTLLPGYGGRVHAAICHPFSPVTPRVWHRADDHGEWIGAWLIGGDSVIEWLEHFGHRAWPRSRVTWLGLTRCRHRTGSSPRCQRSPAGRRCPSATQHDPSR